MTRRTDFTRTTPLFLDYELLDSGEGRKLERFGSRVLIRPSKTASWPHLYTDEWNNAHAEYIPEKGWRVTKGTEASWILTFGDSDVRGRLQTNGQVGIFPEHSLYFEEISQFLSRRASTPSKVLNLFGFTGMASMLCARHGAEVTHVDLSKQAIEWARENEALISSPHLPIRYIIDDALTYLDRCKKRELSFDLVIADPPSFSRITQKKVWHLDDEFRHFISTVKGLLNEQGLLVLSSHLPEWNHEVVTNHLLSFEDSAFTSLLGGPLSIKESHSGRTLPSGSVTLAYHQ
jgi:23S rRNA (cytosine1962-C5)-methyltransferase